MTAEHVLDHRPLAPMRQMANNVPEVTAHFWIINERDRCLAPAGSLAVQFTLRR
ncbi:hypothetical protein ACIP2Y_43940 [Streptomyces sviceus]|uniref:hypothetical protein n=1 Tax=Streptomyces sviceus TaxID=285530 RepID=UPI00380BD2E8